MSHKKVFDHHLKGLELGIQEQVEKEQLLLSSIGQHPIIHSITIINKTDLSEQKKFESSYFLAKKEVPLSLFLKLISHQERHSVIVGTGYHNRTLGTLFLEIVAENLTEGLKEKLNSRNFFGLLTDGSTNSAVNTHSLF